MDDTIKDTIKKKKSDELIRLVTFNVNGIRTFFHYYPFSQMRSSLTAVFDYFDADIISFQELKTDTMAISKWGKVDGFYSFISVPQIKKGYSGVGCWIRILPEGHPRHNALEVVKAEEGITGLLTLKVDGQNVRYRDNLTIGLGGYDCLSIDDEEELLKLDSEGRCVMVELASNIIIISVYCPANSGLTDDGEVFRMNFLKVLFKRIRNFDKMGKKVVLMGDINVCRDLIDSADCISQTPIKLNGLDNGTLIEDQYRSDVQNFVLNPDTPHRRLLNHMLSDSILPELAKDGILIDSTRLIQTRDRLKMYTVWNTLKNTRPSNYGSRIDLILVSQDCKEYIKDSDILPNVMGSDHCPVYTDIDIPKTIEHENDEDEQNKIPKFEARYKYNLMNHDVLSMFLNRPKNPAITTSVSRSNPKLTSKVTKTGIAKRTQSIDSFFKVNKKAPRKPVQESLENEFRNHVGSHDSYLVTDKETIKSFKDVFGKPPMCQHGEEAILKTSKTSQNPGKRFWICHRPRGDLNDTECSCGFFQWA